MHSKTRFRRNSQKLRDLTLMTTSQKPFIREKPFDFSHRQTQPIIQNANPL